ncbi:MAG: hypothetical protein RLZ98_2476, partial [Pseudomonadota bacterium]
MYDNTPEFRSSRLFHDVREAASDLLGSLVTRPDYESVIKTAFGETADLCLADELLRSLASGCLPSIRVVDGRLINDANAAFVADRELILVSRQFIQANSDNTQALTGALLEEIGHFLDSRINAVDAPGDEGHLFSQLVLGDNLTAEQIAALKAEDDHGTITFRGRTFEAEFATQYGDITLDGSLADWTVADRLDTAQSGVAGYEFYGRYAAESFVFALKSPVAIGADTTLWLNTDRNLSTGYQVWGFAAGAEYNINFDAAGVPRLYTGADGQTLVPGAVVDVIFNADRTVAEFAVSGASLGGTQQLDVYVDVNNGVFLPNSYANFTYTVAPAAPPLPPVTVGSITLDGSLSEWTTADRLDSSLGVAGYEIYGRITGDNYVIALKAPEAIGANTTAWLNTDINAATGYQIWGFAGGAEYNVNFDGSGNALLYTGDAGQTPVANGDIVERFSSDRLVVELAIPKELLGFTGAPTAINTLYDFNNSVFLPTSFAATQYQIAPPDAPVVGGVTLDGSLGDWSASYRIDQVSPVVGWEVYGRATADSYVFAIKAPAGTVIGANTTAWLNTDRNPGTGFDIFAGGPVDGGAEYNINFDANNQPFLYTGDAGAGAPIGSALLSGRSTDGSIVEFAVSRSAIGNPAAIDTLYDVNNQTFLPGNFSGPQYTILDTSDLPARTDFTNKVAIVYSETTAARFFGDPALPGQLDINQTAYSQLFMTAQSQALTAGVPFDILTEADLKDLANLVNYDAIVFPSFQFVNAADVAAIETNLALLAQNYATSLVAAGNFMTADETGALLAGDPYARMKALFDLAPDGGSFPANVTVTSAGTGFSGVGGYVAGEEIRTYTNTGYLSFTDATPGTTPLTAIDNQTVNGVTTAAVVTSGLNGDRNVHFSTEALLGDNNQLWQAIQYAVNGDAGPTVGLQLGRQNAIVASRNDMDQSQESFDVDPDGGAPGIYDVLLPILDQWKADYDFVGSYYINVGNNPPDQITDWSVSGPIFQYMLAQGNEIGTHSYTHPEDTNLLSAAEIEFEFNQSKAVIEQQLGITVTGAAIPGAPERLPTSLETIQYFDYLSGGYSAVGAGYPGAFGYIQPTVQDKVYIAPNATFDFTLNQFRNLSPAEADAFWAAEWQYLTDNSDLPVVVWPWHDYGPTEWQLDPPAASPYDIVQFTNYIARAAEAGSEFVTLQDLAARIESLERSSIDYSMAGNVLTATVVSNDAGKFALDIDNLGGEVIASVANWYAYDADSVFTDRDGGTYEITLGAAQDDVTRITSLPSRGELVSLSGDGSNLQFTIVGEGKVTIDLRNVSGALPVVTGATIVSQVGEVLTLDLGAIGTHDVSVSLQSAPAANQPPAITSNGAGASAAISFAENSATPVTTVTASDPDAGQVVTYAIGGADAALFDIDPASGVLSFKSAPDFETPQDAGSDNIYDVVVTATDDGVPTASDTQAIAITVTDVAGMTYNGNASANTQSGTSENDTMNGRGGNDVLSGLAGNDTINGGSGNDTLDGDTGNDTLNGQGGNDTINGGDGNDIITGAGGVDLMTGGFGSDTFVFATASQSGSGTTRDRITDFVPGEDLLDVGAFDANTTVAGV